MADDEKLRILKSGFERLSDEGKEQIMAIIRALLFAQDTSRS